MAIPLAPDQLARFQQHLSRFPAQQGCPICFTSMWNIIGLETGLNVYSQPSTGAMAVAPGGPSMPVVVVVCRTCFFVRHFAWEGIRG